jgi:multiple sugar transport system permease protein
MVGGKQLAGRILRLWLPLAFFLVAMLFPFYWMAVTSIKPNRELYSQRVMPLIVHEPTLKHYIDLFEQTNFLLWTYNTMLIAIVTTIVSLVLGVMIAYPLARLNFPGAAVVAIGVAATYLVPQPLLFIPMADIINRLDLGNTLSAVMLTYPTLLIPFCAWLLMGYFKSVPRELEEAARIDGASHLRTFIDIVLPISRGALASMAIINIGWVWSELFFGLVLLDKLGVRTLPLAVAAYKPSSMAQQTAVGELFAIMCLTVLPMIIFYFIFQKQIRKGMTAGAVK